MRIHRLTLRNVKGVRERTVDFPDTGVIVIEGPNEVGKSTLLEAVDRLLDIRCKASSRSQAVRAMQPVGLDEGPYVEAELTVGPYRVVFAKRWLRQTSTTLTVLTPVQEQLSGDDAQMRMSGILDECLDRPLFEALRFAQAGELTQVALADSSVLTEALDGAAGADLHTEGGADLLSAVEQEFLTYFTPTGRPTGPLRAGITQARAAQEQAVLAHQRVDEADQLLADRASAQAAAAAAARLVPELEGEVDWARVAAEAALAVVAATDRAVAAEQEARAHAQRSAGDVTSRQRLIEEVARRRASSEALRASAEQAQASIDPLRRALVVAEGRAHAAQEALAGAQQVLGRAMLDRDHLVEVAELAALGQRLARAGSLGADLAEAETLLACHPVTPALLRRITDAGHTVDTARAALEAVATVLSVQALTDGQVVEVDGVAETLDCGGDASSQRTLSRETSIVVPGAVRVVVRPQADVTARADRCEAAERAFRDVLAEAGVDDLASARAAADEHDSATREVTRLCAELSATLGSDTLEGLAARVHVLRDSTSAYTRERGDEEGLPADVDQARAVQQAAQRDVLRAQQQVEQSGQQCAQARQAVTEALQHAEVTRSRHEAGLLELHRQEEQLARGRAVLDDETLEARAGEASTRHATAVTAWSAARQALAEADPSAAESRLQQALEALRTQRAEAERVRDRLNQLTGRVEMVAAEGRQEAFELAVQTFDEARDQLMSVDRRARAARQLHRTLQQHRDQAHASYVRPYAAELERLGQQVYGGTFGVSVSSDLVITHRHLDGTTVPFDSLSGGAKEQLGILARLAVATLVDPEHGVPVVIDDALGYTDPERLQRVGAVLGAPAASSQVILLTCTPSRYDGIPGATTISLTALTA